MIKHPVKQQDAPAILRKPNETLVMVPRIGKMTAVGRKVYNVLLHQSQKQIAQARAQGMMHGAGDLFEMPLSDIAGMVTEGDSDVRTLAKKYLREMRRIEVDWEAPDAQSGVIFKSMGLLAEAALEIRDGQTWVTWQLPATIYTAVSDPERYTPVDLDYMSRLKLYASIALYEICGRYRNNPSGVTSKNPPEWWADALSVKPAAIDPDTGVKKPRVWRKIKEASVLDAINEINTKTDLTIDLIEHKTGRAVTEVQFAVKRKAEEPAPGRAKVSADLAEKAAAAGVSLKVVQDEIVSGRDEAEIGVAIASLANRQGRDDLAPVKSTSAYVRGILRENGGVIRPAEPAAVQKRSEPPEAIDPRHQQVVDALEAMPAAALAVIGEQAFDSLPNVTRRSVPIVRAREAGNWRVPLLWGRILRIKGDEMFGPGWDQVQGGEA